MQSGVQDGTVGNQCPQALPENLSCKYLLHRSYSSLCRMSKSRADGSMTVAYPLLAGLESWSEDCLFLDIMVPGKAIRGEAENLPVLFWIFGGGYGKPQYDPLQHMRSFPFQSREVLLLGRLLDHGTNGCIFSAW
jgi:hypothetical protein